MIGRADEQGTPFGAQASRCRVHVWGLFAEPIWASGQSCRIKQAGHMIAVAPPSNSAALPLHPRGRSLIASPTSTGFFCCVLPSRGHGSLRGRRLPPQHLVRSAGAAMSTTGSRARTQPNGLPRSQPAPSPRKATRIRVSLSREWIASWPGYALAGCSGQRNGSPDRQMLCRTTDSFRASATRALPGPDRLAIACAQSFNPDTRLIRPRITTAAS